MHKRNLRLSIEYDGTRYLGWQRLGGERNQLSIQGILEQHLTTILQENIKIVGSGRTDAGVHALCQVANFFTHTDLSFGEICKELNRLLPEDIAISSVDEVPLSFHSRYSAISKTYEYCIDNSERQSVFKRRYSYHIAEDLDIKRMRVATGYLVGTHDFASFRTDRLGMKDSDRDEMILPNSSKSGEVSDTNGRKDSRMPCSDTIRTISSITITENRVKHNREIHIRFEGDGFLYNMVRIMVGTIVEVGLGKRQPIEVKQALDKPNRQMAGMTMPSQGLFLIEVKYEI